MVRNGFPGILKMLRQKAEEIQENPWREWTTEMMPERDESKPREQTFTYITNVHQKIIEIH